MRQRLKRHSFGWVLFTLTLYMPVVTQATTEITPTYDLKRPLPSNCYTQGLSLDQEVIWLSCGQYGQSKFFQLLSSNWSVNSETPLPHQWFAEGIAAANDSLILLTWKNQLVARFNKHDLRDMRTEQFAGEAWGLANTNNGTLIISDGSSVLRWLKPDDLTEINRIVVKEGNQRVANLNELEWVGAHIWANVWQSDRIAIIDPLTGQVNAWLDLTEISRNERAMGGEVLNGIVYIPSEEAVYVTGKWWQYAYRLPLDQFSPKAF